MNDQPSRKPNRLGIYDYSMPGYYFITICTQNKEKLLWELPIDLMKPSSLGEIVDTCIQKIPYFHPYAIPEKYAVMPNHVHIILQLLPNDSGKTVSTIVGHMKRAVSTAAGRTIWQKGFHDHVIRNEREFQEIWAYIDYNPAKWVEDCYYSE